MWNRKRFAFLGVSNEHAFYLDRGPCVEEVLMERRKRRSTTLPGPVEYQVRAIP